MWWREKGGAVVRGEGRRGARPDVRRRVMACRGKVAQLGNDGDLQWRRRQFAGDGGRLRAAVA